MSTNLPDFRRCPDGVLIGRLPSSPTDWNLSPAARRRLLEAQSALDRLSAGWRPRYVDLVDAPVIEGWTIRLMGDEPILVGLVSGHPRWPDSRPVGTSLLIAIDRRWSWARTLSRFYRLGRPSDEELAS